MFRVRASTIYAHVPTSAAIVLFTLMLAFALSVAAVYQVFQEYRLLGDWVARAGAVPAAEINSLRRDLGARISSKDRGTGMGLALTEKLVGQHEGRIDFRTRTRGTIFSIGIPLESGMGANGKP